MKPPGVNFILPTRKKRILFMAMQLLVLLMVIKEGSSALSPGDQAKVAVSFQDAEFLIKEVQSYTANYAKTVKNMQISETFTALQKAQKLEKITKIAGTITKALSAVSGVFAIFSFVSTFFMPSQLDIIKEQFEVVNNKLNAIAYQIDSVRDELLSSIEFNAWLTTYIDWEFAIRNGDTKLTETQARLAASNSEQEKLNFMREYTDYFENQDIGGKALNIYQLTAKQSTTTQKNLFELYVEEKGCDITELSRLMLIVKDLMVSSAKQEMVHQFLKYGKVDLATETFRRYHNLLYDIRRRYDLHVWYCKRRSIENAKKEIQKIYEKNKDVSSEALSISVQHRLQDFMPWYEWAAAVYEEASEISVVFKPCVGGVKVEASGSELQFATTETSGGEKNKKLLIVWQSAQDISHGCGDIEDAHTFVPFKLCKDCNSDALTVPDNIVSMKTCPSHLYDIFESKLVGLYCSHTPQAIERSDIEATVRSGQYSYIAAGFSALRNPCVGNSAAACNDHGVCRHVPDTSTHMCLCHEYYEGEFCEQYYDPAAAHNIIGMLSSLRQGFADFMGVPTVTDVYLEIRQIPQQMEMIRKRIQDTLKFTQILSQYGGIFTSAEHIASAYNEFLEGDLSALEFSLRIENINFYTVISGLQRTILGQGVLLSHDLLTSYKKSLIADSGPQTACTQQYSEAVSALMKNLAILDQSISETLLCEARWKLENLAEPGDGAILDAAQEVLDAAMDRQRDYAAYWRKTSCPKLTTPDLQEKYCDENQSYEGMTVNLHCDNSKTPSSSSVTCIKRGDVLQWSQTPECRYVWQGWGSWSSCSRTCGTGQRTRQRSKPNGEKDTQTQDCNTQDCCQSRYGKFKCSNGNCINKDYVCDGDNDCGNGDDETRSRCSYLRVGDTIALRSACGGFLSCYCSVNCDQNCRTMDCPGDSMEGSDWNNCRGERFNYITARGRTTGDAIRFGDGIAIRYASDTGDQGWWLSCWVRGSSCTTRTCPGKHFEDDEYDGCRGELFFIYALGRQGSCGSDTRRNCKGKPIYPGDEVFILYTFYESDNGYWLSMDGLGYDVKTRSCPSRYFSDSLRNQCDCERWTLYRR